MCNDQTLCHERARCHEQCDENKHKSCLKILCLALFSVWAGLSASCVPPDRHSAGDGAEAQAVHSTTEKEGFYRPSRDLPKLFHQVQMQRVFSDSKTFVDSRPLKQPQQIAAGYEVERENPQFELAVFVEDNFQAPPVVEIDFEIDDSLTMAEHLASHWNYLLRDATAGESRGYSTLIPLPEPYVVPGGRFREIYYWDSYFTMRGLVESGREDLMDSMLQNFAWLIGELGFIPNGNRTYYLSRSQPPFFAAMVSLYAEVHGEQAAVRFLPQLETEYRFWMANAADAKAGVPQRRVVRMPDGSLLNRYYDALNEPRPESYREDVLTAQSLVDEERPELYRDIRAAAESGWDFSSRWMGESRELQNLNTTDIVPVDLNSLLYHLEATIARLAAVAGRDETAELYQSKAGARRQAIHRWLWDEQRGRFGDWNVQSAQLTDVSSLATVYPLYFGLATQEQADEVAQDVESRFLYPGGLVTTLTNTGEQWDFPNGWAPLQWLAVKGLDRYGHYRLADTVARRWLALNRRVFEQQGQMMEKYNVVDLDLPAGGGEYPLQDGFGWTNGVALALLGRFGQENEQSVNHLQ